MNASLFNAVLWLALATAFAFLLAWAVRKWAFQFVDTVRQLVTIPPVWLDGLLYVAIAFFNGAAAFLGNDEAAKYIGPFQLWLLRGVCYVIGQTLLALKMFRSTSYADSLAVKKNDTGFYRVEAQPPKETKP